MIAHSFVGAGSLCVSDTFHSYQRLPGPGVCQTNTSRVHSQRERNLKLCPKKKLWDKQRASNGSQNFTIAMFPSFYAHFEVSHQKRVMETWISNKNALFAKNFLRSLEVVLCEKGLMRIMGDGNAFEKIPQAHQKSHMTLLYGTAKPD